MRKSVLLFSILLIGMFSVASYAQVLADFENAAQGTQTFYDGNWGTLITGISQVPDPTGTSNGVLKISMDANLGATEKDPIATNSITSLEGEVLSFNVWLPAGSGHRPAALRDDVGCR